MDKVTHFSYGANHLDGKGFNRFTTIDGVDDETAREIQMAIHGPEWAFQYPDDEQWQQTVKRHGLSCYEHVTVRLVDEG